MTSGVGVCAHTVLDLGPVQIWSFHMKDAKAEWLRFAMGKYLHWGTFRECSLLLLSSVTSAFRAELEKM